MVRKVQEKKERERVTAGLSEEKGSEGQDGGVVEPVEEKLLEDRYVTSQEKDGDLMALTKSVRSMSL